MTFWELSNTPTEFVVYTLREPGTCTMKLFMAVIYGFLKQARVFVPGKPFQPSLMFFVRPEPT